MADLVAARGGFPVRVQPLRRRHAVQDGRIVHVRYLGAGTLPALTPPVRAELTRVVYVVVVQVYFFVLTGLLVFLLPFTYATLFGGAERAAARVKAPCSGWNRKSREVRRTTGQNRLFSIRCVLEMRRCSSEYSQPAMQS